MNAFKLTMEEEGSNSIIKLDKVEKWEGMEREFAGDVLETLLGLSHYQYALENDSLDTFCRYKLKGGTAVDVEGQVILRMVYYYFSKSNY